MIKIHWPMVFCHIALTVMFFGPLLMLEDPLSKLDWPIAIALACLPVYQVKAVRRWWKAQEL